MPVLGSFHLNSGFDIPYFGLGLFQIKEKEVLGSAISAALASGYRLLDTAKFYANEEQIGDVLKDSLAANNLSRTDIFITTKVFLTIGDNKTHVRSQVEESLKQLQLDYLDLVLIHYPRPFFPGGQGSDKDPMNKQYRQDAYEELLKLKEEGKIRSVGVSNFEISHLQHLEEAGLPTPAVNQLQFHPHMHRKELKEYCEKNGIFFQAFTSLGRHDPRLLEEPALVRIATNHGVAVQPILLAWALHHKAGVLPKSQTPSRIADNWKSQEIVLADDELAALDGLENGNSYSPTTGWNVL